MWSVEEEMAVRMDGTSLVILARLEEQGNSSSYSQSQRHSHTINKDQNMNISKRTPQNPSMPFLSLTKPSWTVKTESNVRKEKRKKPEPSCVVCQGTGRADCHDCRGKGRTNHVDSEMLPRGEWPKWCRTCGGSGLSYCSRCLGTGEYRYIMGFHFMNSHQHHQDG